MHVVMFSMNRAFHKVMEVGLRLTAEFGLTPSRFQLLNVLLCQGSSLRQMHLRKILGVSAPNVSRMVSSLEQLGLVVRRRDAHGRTCGVELTEVGRDRVARAADWLVRQGNAREAVEAFFPSAGTTSNAANMATRKAVLQFARALGRVRRALKDPALLEYDEVHQQRQPDAVRCWGAAVGRAAKGTRVRKPGDREPRDLGHPARE
ncbi:MAG: MarR family [Myxococcaceae bacterium]|nr:MarR family [Myxococcaceae bacterium]